MCPGDTVYLKSHFLYGEDFQYRKGILVIEEGIIKGFTGEHIRDPIIHRGVVIPPLINAHTHVGDNVIKDIGINKTLDELVKPPHGLKHVLLNACSDEELIEGILDGLEELRNNGITYFCDFREGGLKGINLLREGYRRYNRRFPCPLILGRPTTSNREELKKEIGEILKVADGIGLSGCNEYSDRDLKTIRKLDYKMFSIHANEHRGSIEYSRKTYGMSEIERIVDLKLHPTFIVHATYTTPYERELLREHNIPVVLCPRANASFNVGLPDIHSLMDKGILTGLGTDNFMANSPSILKEMDFIYKLYHIDPKEILRFATINNSRILGLEDIGLIEEGYRGVFTFIRDCPSIRYSKNIVASIITRCEKGEVVIYGGDDDKGSY